MKGQRSMERYGPDYSSSFDRMNRTVDFSISDEHLWIKIVVKGGSMMEQILKCRDMGLVCNSVICGQTKKEVMKEARAHAEFMHYIKGNPKGLYEKAWPAIHEGNCEGETQLTTE